MSNVIDRKVVEMQFDNRQFEKNVTTTMNSVDKLNKNLDGLNSISSKNGGLSKLGEDLDDVRRRAEWLREFDIANWINNKLIYPLVTVLPRTFSELFGGVASKAGFGEYELKMGSIQTIMAGTGESMEKVNQKLGELNEYSDKTIYSFQDMTSNIGKFTNAGVSLDDSVAAIQGVANVAAISGANANEASRAMYNFAQAMSTGHVKLIDWKSIENANMATVEFKNQLLETAVAEGKLTKTSDGMYKTLKGTTISATKMFNDSLQEQWMTSEVLTKTLKKYSDTNTEIGKKATQAATEVKTLSQLYDTLKESAQSGWAQTWEIIVGDFEEAKAFLSELNDTLGGLIGKAADARNELLENWKVMGGRDDIIETFRNLVKAIGSFIAPIKEAWGEIFNPLTSEGLKNFTEGIRNFTQSLILSEGTAENLKRVFKGVFSVLSIVVEIFKGFGAAIGIVTEDSNGLADGLLGLLAIVGDILSSLADFIKETKIIKNAFIVVGKTIKFILSILGTLVQSLVEGFECGPLEIFSGLLDGISTKLAELADSSTDFGERFKMAFKNLGSAIKNSEFFIIISSLLTGIKGMAVGLVKGIVNIFKGIGSAIMSGDVGGLFEMLSKLLDGGILVGLGLLVKKIVDLLGGSGLVKTIKNVCESVSQYFGALSKNINAGTLKKIADAIGILTLALIALAFIPADKLEKSLAAITLAFGELLFMFAMMSKIGKASMVKDGKGGFVNAIKGVTDSIASINTMVSMMVALLGMTWVIQRMGNLDVDTLIKGVTATTILLAAMTGVMIALSKFQIASKETLQQGNDKLSIKYTNQIKGMVTMALALLILSVPLKVLGSMEWEAWARAVGGIVILLAAMMGVEIGLSRLGQSGKTMLAGSGAVAIMASAINMIIPTLLLLGVIPFPIILKGIGGLAMILAAMMGVEIGLSRLGKSGKTMLAGAGAVAIMAATLWTVMPMLLTLGIIPFKIILKGIGGLALILVALGGVEVAFGLLGDNAGKRMLAGAGAIAIMIAVLNMVLPTLLLLGVMPWQAMLQGIGGLLGVLGVFSAALIVMVKMTQGVEKGGTSMILAATAMVIMAAALNILTPALIALALVPFPMLLAALGTLVVTFGLFIGTAWALKALAPSLVTVAGAMALFAAAALGISVSLALMGWGFKYIAAGLLALVGVLAGIIGSAGLIVAGIIKILDLLIVSIIELLINAVGKLAELISVLIVELCEVIVDNVPRIVQTLLVVLTEVLASIAEFIPQIVGYLIDIIAGIIQTIIDKLPEIFSKINFNPETLNSLLTVVLKLSGFMVMLAALKILGKAAMQGVLYMGAVVAELALVLAAFGLLYKIPYLGELVEGGGEFLRIIGVAIGKFIGGIIGGVASGAASTLPQIGEYLSGFINNATAFIEGIKNVDESVLTSTKNLVSVILALTGANILESIASWLTGKSSISSFGDELVSFAPKIKEYSEIVKGIDTAAVEASANAARCLSELAHNLPNSGGLVGWLAGENDISDFGEMLVPFGRGLAEFSKTVVDVDTEAIANVIPAAKSLSELANNLPNTGGLIAFFSGDNTMDVFGEQLAGFGRGIKSFATEVSGLVDDGSMDAAVSAAKSIVELSNNIPNQGGVVAWFTGENNIASFSSELAGLGRGIKDFAIESAGVDPAAVTAAVNAGKALAELTSVIPSEGGVVAWFTGENSVTSFADSLPALGNGIKGFAYATSGISVEAVIAAAEAAKVLAEMTNVIPKEGGVKAWFSGESSLSKFSTDILSLGQGIKGFAQAVTGINCEAVSAASTACKTLAEMTSVIPNEGGLKKWISGESSVSKFGTDLSALGQGIKGFADKTAGITPESVTAAAAAAKDIAAMVAVIPSEGGLKKWISGEQSVSKYASELPKLGEGLSGFSEKVTDINKDNVTAAAIAGESIAKMVKVIPSEGGIKAWFSGENSVSKFADKLPGLGKGLAGFAKEVGDINPDNVKAAASAAKSLAEMAKTAPKDSKNIINFGTNLKSFGTKLKEYFNAVKAISGDTISAASKAVDEVKEIASINAGNIKSVANAIKELTKAIKQMATDIKDDLKKAGKEAIEAFVKGIEGNTSSATKACKTALDACVDAIGEKKSSFETAGKNLVSGFANGISLNQSVATKAARSMAAAAAEAAKAELKEHSPSRVGVEIGDYFGIGFVNGIAENVDKAYGMSSEMANSAKEGLRNTINKLGDIITNDIDSQPTIRPVLDLTDVKSGAGVIKGLFNSTTLGVSANVGNISALMSRYNQNEANVDIVSAIDALRKDVKQMETASYSIGNVSLTGDQEVEEAFNTIIRAVNMARRT